MSSTVGLTVLIIVVSLALAIGSTLLCFRFIRSLISGTPENQKKAAELTKSGAKARAQIMASHPTGMVVNNVYIRTVLRFEIVPLNGGAPFDGEKTMLIDQTVQPRIGDVWPCWYDPSDTTTFAVGQPTGDARDQIEIFREFGIKHPLDR